MVFLPFPRITLFFLFFIHFSFQSRPQQPACKDSFPTSLLFNSSFEQYSGCNAEYGGSLEGGYIDAAPGFGGIIVPGWHSFRGHSWEIHYYNYNCRINDPVDVFNPPSNGGCFENKAPQPLPDSNSFIAITEEAVTMNYNGEKDFEKTYIATCLSEPLYAGQPYVFTFYFGFGQQGSGSCLPPIPPESISPYWISLFSRQDCPDYPLSDASTDSAQGCLTNHRGWVELGKVRLHGRNQWVQGVIEFTPSINITSIGVGSSCNNYPRQDQTPT